MMYDILCTTLSENLKIPTKYNCIKWVWPEGLKYHIGVREALNLSFFSHSFFMAT